MEISNIALVLSMTSAVLTVITAFFSILAYAKVVGMEKSTHRIEYMAPPVPSRQDEQGNQVFTNPTGKDLARRFMSDNLDDY